MAPKSKRHWTSVRGTAPGLEGIPCHVDLHIAKTRAGVMVIDEGGEVRISDQGEPNTLLAVDCDETLVDLLRGDLPPIVAHLQGRLRFDGDRDLALRVLFGLQEGSPWAEPAEAGAAS
jgi:putative sterol carrier protein